MNSTAPGPRPAQVFLGLFVVWQLTFMVMANYLQLVFPENLVTEDEAADLLAKLPPPGPIEKLTRTAAGCLQSEAGRYAQVTGQGQSWWLFAAYPRQSTFPLIELRWSDPAAFPPVRLHGRFEPENPNAYFHAPGPGDRLFHYEANLTLIHNPWDTERFNSWSWDPEEERKHAETQAETHGRHREQFTPDRPWYQRCQLAHVGDGWSLFCSPWEEERFRTDRERYQRSYLNRAREKWRPALAYMEWQLEQYRQLHPELPMPAEVILYNRVYPTPARGTSPWQWPAPHDHPVFRWHPGETTPAEVFPVEVYDPAAGGFVRVNRSKDSS
ncbi:MAG: hypothetical protein K2R98_09625 [Gemmataceae bacterium]|nr:hypothetical protein [Gemmataceae bacterium]